MHPPPPPPLFPYTTLFRSTSLTGATVSADPDGFVAALFAGYDWQLPNNFVIGARISAPVWSSAQQTTTDPLVPVRSEEHTSELQSPCKLVCRLLLEKKKKK